MKSFIKQRSLPRPGCWFRFTDADWQFIQATLAESAAGREALLRLFEDADALRMILTHPKLFEALMARRCGTFLSPEFFFFLMVLHALESAAPGERRFDLADYIAVVCAEFGCRADAHPRLADSRISGLYSIDYLEALSSASRHERFFLHVQCANQFLVLTCLYPDYLHARAMRRGAPDVDYYEEVVVNHLQAASRHILAQEFAVAEVFQSLVDDFPKVRRALNHTAREFLALG